MKFICPDCGCEVVEVVMSDCIVSETIDVTDPDNTTHGVPEIHDSYNDRYQCSNCGWVVPVEPNAVDDDALFEWLKKQEYNKEKK